MQELTINQMNQVAGGAEGTSACTLAAGGLGVVGGLNASVAGYASALAFGGPVGWAVGLGTAAIYGGMSVFAAHACE